MLALVGYFVGLGLVALIVVFYIYRVEKKKEATLTTRVHSLEHDLAQSNVDHIHEAQQNEFDAYARIVVSQMDKALIVIHKNGTVRLINSHAKQFLDINAEVGMPYKDLFHIRFWDKTDNYASFDAAFSGKTQYLSDNTEFVSSHGSFPISGTIMPLQAGDTVEAVVFIFENSSKHMTQVKEEQAFFSAAAHELRTPLTIIRMTVSLLREKFDTLPKERILEHLRRTDETTDKLVTLVNQFLNISRIDQGRLDIKFEKFDMVAFTDEVIQNLTPLAKERNLYIHHDVQISQRTVAGDKAKSLEVLTNILTNGIKYTVRGGITITHSVYDTTFETTISDTGTGIAKEAQGLLFKRFGQVGEARQEVPSKSTGLGLYISKRFAQLMRGDVRLVRSEPGQGSTFAFTLPLS